MAALPDTERDHGPLLEVFTWLGDIIDGFDQYARDYATRYWLYLTSQAARPNPPMNLHPALAKAIREEVTSQAHLDRRIVRRIR